MRALIGFSNSRITWIKLLIDMAPSLITIKIKTADCREPDTID
jgi:hypothetical protein